MKSSDGNYNKNIVVVQAAAMESTGAIILAQFTEWSVSRARRQSSPPRFQLRH